MSTLQTTNLKHPDSSGTQVTFTSGGDTTVAGSTTFSSPIKASKLENASTTDGGIAVDTAGHVAIDGANFPTAGPLSNRNLIINGDMRIAQRAAEATNAGAGFDYLTVDRFKTRNNGPNSARYTITQNADSPDNQGFDHSLGLEVTTAKGTLSSNQYQGVSQIIEGLNLQQLCYGTSNAKDLTLSFWVKSSVTGQYSCHISNWSNGRNISRPYTIDTANTWERKTITIPGDPTTTIPNLNQLGLEIGWILATTSFYNDGTDGSVWHNTSDAGKRHSGQVVEFGAAIGDTWRLTGVQLEVGSKDTAFEHEGLGQALTKCQRYFNMLAADSYDPVVSMTCFTSGTAYGVYIYPVEMRADPTLYEQDIAEALRFLSNNSVDLFNGNTFYLDSSRTSTKAARLQVTSSISVTQGHAGWVELNNQGLKLGLDAEI